MNADMAATTSPTSPRAQAMSEQVPAVASAREYLRTNMPAIYRNHADGFGMCLLGSLERVLDPQVAILDCLAAYLSSRLGPESMVQAMSAWLGLPPAESYGQSTGRELLSAAEQLARERGTRSGLELALSRCFPDLHLQVRDHGAVLIADESDTPAPYPGFTVSCREPLSPARRVELERAIEWQRPLQVSYTLEDGSRPPETAR